MIFTSLQFLLFFPAVCVLYFLLRGRRASAMLLAASYLFYMAWEPSYSLLLIFKTLLSYVTALRMDAARDPAAHPVRRFTTVPVGEGAREELEDGLIHRHVDELSARPLRVTRVTREECPDEPRDRGEDVAERERGHHGRAVAFACHVGEPSVRLAE